MKLIITLIVFCFIISSCKDFDSSTNKTPQIDISYFGEDFHAYINANGWTVWQGGRTGVNLHYLISRSNTSRDDKSVEIEIVCDGIESNKASSLVFRYPVGDKDAELLLQAILDNVKGADKILIRVDNTKK